MRFLNTSGVSVFFSRGLAVGAVIGLFLAAETVQATSSKYKRHSTSSAASNSSANPSASPAPAPNGSNGDQKVDLTNLENRYWTAKDTEFNVVQNRLYTKAHKFSLTPQVGAILNDQYTTAYNFGLALNYYFSERQGIELQGWRTSATDADFVSSFGSQYGVIPDHNVPQGYVGLNYNWVPIYAKMSFLEKRILYFDMSVNPGIGLTFLKADTFATAPTFVSPNATTSSPVTFALDIAQQVFISEHFAIRLDLRNHVYGETIYSAENGGVIRNKTTFQSSVMLGVTLFQ